ncbi:MAG: hypothetical protein C4329_10780, partial [Chitinophagaceae bacterium]
HFYLLSFRRKNSPKTTALITKKAENPKQVVLPQVSTTLVSAKMDTAAVTTPITSADTINSKLNEIYALKKQIPSVINQANDTSVATTKQKIFELLKKIDDLKSRTTKVESENKFLKTMLEQLTKELKAKEQNIRLVSQSSRSSNATVGPESNKVFIADIRVNAVNENGQETNRAEEAARLAGSFIVRSNVTNASFYVVVTQPNGKVLQSSSWDGGAFETAEGRKLYTSKVLLDSETKRPAFSITSDNLQKGNYIVQVYYNGTMIGRSSKTLLRLLHLLHKQADRISRQDHIT